ncbi:MAG: aldo/keto reductase [Planctomycetes bacterium]|nr:aldo/keto reductase [Planctomycetota bacterium]
MDRRELTRRAFFRNTAAIAGAMAAAPLIGIRAAEPAAKAGASKATAVDQIALGKTGLKLSRLGMGTGSNSGNVQRALGRDGFIRLIRHGLDRGITYIDTAESYRMHEWVKAAIEGIPREKLFIQTKMSGTPEKPLEVLDRFRKELGVEYIDSVLTHCTVTPNWDDERKRVVDALAEAKQKGIIRAKGTSCHALPALARAATFDWVDVNLVRINPQGAHMDTPSRDWNARSNASCLLPVIDQMRIMRRNGHGIIGMKIIGNGDFTDPVDRQVSIRFAIQSGLSDAIVIGFKSPAEIDEAIQRIDRALAELA